MKHKLPHVPPVYATGAAATLVVLSFIGYLSWYGYTRIEELSSQITDLQAELGYTTEQLEARIAEATTTIEATIEQERRNVTQKVNSITGTVSTLEKLTKIDRELLAKYSKVFFLSDNYEPARVTEIPEKYRYDEKDVHQIVSEVLPYLRKLLDAAAKDDVEIYVKSAYRSFKEQTIIKSSYTVTYGAGTANTFSADQGYSEHQLGTTVDFITTGLKGRLDGFEKTDAYEWLLDNAYKYGFVLTYPKGNSYYIFEPWHWRFVGVKLATDLHKDGKYLYELDQRTIDTYLPSLFD